MGLCDGFPDCRPRSEAALDLIGGRAQASRGNGIGAALVFGPAALAFLPSYVPAFYNLFGATVKGRHRPMLLSKPTAIMFTSRLDPP